MKKLLLLTQWFDPEPTFKGLLFAKALKGSGFDVEVVTGFPNYPSGKIYDGYKVKLIQTEHIDGIRVNRVPLYPSHGKSALKRILNYCTFAFSALIYCLFVLKRKDLIYCYHPPLTIGISAVLVSKIRRIPLVYDIQDMWPDTLAATGMINNARILSIIGKLSIWVYQSADHLVVLSPGFKKLLIDRGVPSGKIDVIPNWCDEKALEASSPLSRENFPAADVFKVMFAGNIGKAQALDSLIAVAEQLQLENLKVQFIFLGDGIDAERLKLMAEEKQLANVIFLPSVPMNRVGSYLKQADALFVHLKNDHLFRITIPSKTQAYMSIGKPIIMGVAGDAADIVRAANCGVVVEPENAVDIAKKIKILADMPILDRIQLGENGKKYYNQNISLSIGVEKFSNLFMSLSQGGKP